MKYGTCFSGIEAPTVAWEPLGWEAQWFSEIDKFPKEVLKQRYPTVPDLGDITKVDWDEQADIDVLIGGSPCQSYSLAGLRKGLADPRGNLALEFLRVVDSKKPRWVIWENVPGVLSSNGGRDFGTIVGSLAELGYGVSWRILDARYFGLAQRRKRVFVVGYLGDWRPSTAVLFEQESMQRGNNQSNQKKSSPTANVEKGAGEKSNVSVFNLQRAGQYGTEDIGSTCLARDYKMFTDLICFHPRQSPVSDIVSMPCETKGPMAIATNEYVRGLTEIEVERLQGFPDNHTRIPWRNKEAKDCPKGHRYKALGNSMAVPVVRWIGERIQEVEEILKENSIE